MNVIEMTAILGRFAQLDARLEVTDETVETWHDLLGDLQAEDVAAAFKKHYGATEDRAMPAHIRRLVNGAPDAGRQARDIARKAEEYAAGGVGKPEWFDAEAEKWKLRAREDGRHCHCLHHGDGWASEPYWEHNR